jgi:two-component system, LytTR family, sensor kinase
MADESPPISAGRPGWALYSILALLFGAYLGVNQIVNLHGKADVEPWKPLVWELSSAIVIFAVVPLIVRFERSFRLDARPRWRIILAHAGAAFLFSAWHVAAIVVLRKSVYAFAGQTYDFGDVPVRFFYELQKDLLAYVIILGVIFANREFQVRRTSELRATELAAELGQARLKALTAQIEPHFLFNALNAISNRMHEDIEAADRMISNLGALMRAAYDSDNQVLVPLERELAWLRDYAAMMSERFRGQLCFELKVAPGLETLQVPRLLLQPLVENALRHGLPDGRGNVTVDVARQGTRLLYTIRDNGVGVDVGGVNPGTGLSNVARRLELLFPGAHTFTVAAGHPTGTEATLSFPVA